MKFDIGDTVRIKDNNMRLCYSVVGYIYVEGTSDAIYELMDVESTNRYTTRYAVEEILDLVDHSGAHFSKYHPCEFVIYERAGGNGHRVDKILLKSEPPGDESLIYVIYDNYKQGSTFCVEEDEIYRYFGSEKQRKLQRHIKECHSE